MDPIALFRLDRELAQWRKIGRAPIMWWRDDDARAPTPQLDRLIGIAAGAPLSLAVIPDGDLPSLANRLRDVPGVTIAQHGVDHENRRPAGGPRSEFSHGTTPQTVSLAVAAGRRQMEQAGFAPAFFVPPWNESDPNLLRAIRAADYHAYSVGIYGRPEEGLLHFGAQVDFLRWKGKPRFRSSGRIFNVLRRQLEWRRNTGRFAEPIGILTHHLVHDERTWRFLEWFLSFARVRFHWMSFPEMLDMYAGSWLKLVGVYANEFGALEPSPPPPRPRLVGIDGGKRGQSARPAKKS
jgi:peptidoglycan/xylan/chitin deacetylase (PgdA/CDA1 family)